MTLMAIDTRRGPIASTVSVDRWEEAQMEISALGVEAQVHARYNIPRAERLRNAMLREGLFAEHQDASAILGSLQRMERRHERLARRRAA